MRNQPSRPSGPLCPSDPASLSGASAKSDVSSLSQSRDLAILLSCDDIVYIAGPMSGCKLFNYPAFFAMEGLLKKEFGCKVLNPARQPNGLAYEEYMKRAFEDVRKASVVVMLNNWTLSDGAQREYHLAKFEQIKVISQIQVEKFIHEKFRSEFGDFYKA